jgi:putative ABC transport system substrate-binding protein
MKPWVFERQLTEDFVLISLQPAHQRPGGKRHGEPPRFMCNRFMSGHLLRRRDFVAMLGFATCTGSLPVRAQQRERMRRVGVMMSLAIDDPEATLRVNAFEGGLRELGWVEGRNMRPEYRWAVGDVDVLRAEAAALVGLKPEVILASGTPVLAALIGENHSVPMVFAQVIDPVGSGFVPNLARPGGQITGFTGFEFTIGSKWVEALTQIAYWTKRAALIFNPETAPFAPRFWPAIESAAASFGLEAIKIPIRSVAEIQAGLAAFARELNGGIIVMPDVTTVQNRDLIIALAARHQLPAVYPYRFFAASGGLLSYGSDVSDVFRRAAGYVDRILKGTSPGELPVQAPAKYELVINLKTAKATGFMVPPYLLARADEVIE